MPADGCVRCHKNTPPRRPHGSVWVCINRKACRRRQATLVRRKLRGVATTPFSMRGTP